MLQERIIVYRLQHKVSKLGPFEHRLKNGNPSKLASKLVYHKNPSEFSVFHDWLIKNRFEREDQLPSEWLFAWNTEEKLLAFVKKGININRYRFEFRSYETDNYLILPDGQVIFKPLISG